MKNIECSGKLNRGDKVKIYNRTPDGKEIFEGEATLIRKLLPQKYAEYWCVKFGKDHDFDSLYRWVRAEDKILADEKTVIPKKSEGDTR